MMNWFDKKGDNNNLYLRNAWPTEPCLCSFDSPLFPSL